MRSPQLWGTAPSRSLLNTMYSRVLSTVLEPSGLYKCWNWTRRSRRLSIPAHPLSSCWLRSLRRRWPGWSRWQSGQPNRSCNGVALALAPSSRPISAGAALRGDYAIPGAGGEKRDESAQQSGGDRNGLSFRAAVASQQVPCILATSLSVPPLAPTRGVNSYAGRAWPSGRLAVWPRSGEQLHLNI